MSESLNELVKPVRADELRSRANTAQLDGQLILNRKSLIERVCESDGEK